MKVRLTDAVLELDELGAGDPLLLLHGFPATGRLWSGVAPRLAEHFRLLVPDLAGYGESRSARIDMHSQADFMLELLDLRGLARVCVVAHDVGTAVAQLMVAQAPERVSKLVLMDGVCGTEWAMEAIGSIQSWDPLKAARLAPVLARKLGKSARKMLSAWEGEEGGLRLIAAARALDPRQTADLAAKLRAFAGPSLVLWGAQDAYLSADEVGGPLATLLHAELVLIEGGHFLPLDAPEAVAARLLEFLRA